MPSYIRWYSPGGTYFFTLVTENRAPLFAAEATHPVLRSAIDRCRSRYPFEVIAMALLPDHLHLLMKLPDDDHDFSVRLRWIKSNFTSSYLAAGGSEQPRSDSRVDHGNRGVWQRRFYEHLCRDEFDVGRHVEYVHFNPVKHGLASCPHGWRASSFHRWVAMSDYPRDWCCGCDEPNHARPDFSWAPTEME